MLKKSNKTSKKAISRRELLQGAGALIVGFNILKPVASLAQQRGTQRAGLQDQLCD